MVAIQPLNPESVPVTLVVNKEAAEAFACIASDRKMTQSQLLEAWVLRYVEQWEQANLQRESKKAVRK